MGSCTHSVLIGWLEVGLRHELIDAGITHDGMQTVVSMGTQGVTRGTWHTLLLRRNRKTKTASWNFAAHT